MNDQMTKRLFCGGRHRIIMLFTAAPSPACEFIPKEDALTLLLRFTITRDEAAQEDAVRILRKILDPRLKINPNKCSVEYGLSSIKQRHYFQITYHAKDMSFGERLYEELCDKIFF